MIIAQKGVPEHMEPSPGHAPVLQAIPSVRLHAIPTGKFFYK